MVEAFDGIYLIFVDVDEWGWGVAGSDFPNVDGIPIFFRLDGRGRATGNSIDGNAWAANTPENIANAMHPWFHR